MRFRCTHLLMVTIVVAAAIQIAEIYLPKTPPPSFATSGTLRSVRQTTACHCPAYDPKTRCKCSLKCTSPSTETPGTTRPVYKTLTPTSHRSRPPITTTTADTPGCTTTSTTPTAPITTTTADAPGYMTTPPTTTAASPPTTTRQTTWYTTTVTDPPTTTTASPTTTTAEVESTTTLSDPRNCQDVLNNGRTTSGVYSIFPDGRKEVKVFCEQTLQGGGWTVFQRRINGSVNFYLGWDEYIQGFGSAGEYWIGNDHLHMLTTNQDTQLLVELRYGGETRIAKYREFWVQDEKNKYKLHVTGYSGGSPPGDSLAGHNGRSFSTHDKDNDNRDNAAYDGNCAEYYSGAWWYHHCYDSNLNGKHNRNNGSGLIWQTWKGWSTSMSAVRMMLKNK